MKKLITPILLCMAIAMPMTAKNVYLYQENRVDPTIVSSEKLYFMPNGEGWNLCETQTVDERDLLHGTYTATAQSMFDYGTETWTVDISWYGTGDEVWISPICEFGGLTGNQINAVYGVVDTVANTISIPYGQCLFGGEQSTYNMVLAGVASGGTPILEGNLVATYEIVEDVMTITMNDEIGVGNTNANEWWYQALTAITMKETTQTEMVVRGTDIAEIDSISTNPPLLKVTDWEVVEETGGLHPSLLINFNHSLENDMCYFDSKIIYTAYDENNNVVCEDAFDLYNTGAYYGRTIEIPMLGFTLDQGGYVLYYTPDAFLPCDTALQVAVSIADSVARFRLDTEVVYPGMKSYVDADGTRHGIVFDYYNERARLLSTSPLTGDNALSVNLEYSKELMTNGGANGCVYFSYDIYSKGDNSAVVYSGLAEGYVEAGNMVRVQVITDAPLIAGEEYIATLTYPCRDERYAGVKLIDSNWCTPAPAKIESYVDADGTPHGLWWEFTAENAIELSVSPATQAELDESIAITTKGADKTAFLISPTEIDNIDWRHLLNRNYGNTYISEVLPEGYEFSIRFRSMLDRYDNMFDVGHYYLYVLAVNEKGQMATYSTPYELVDNIGPHIVSESELISTNGRTVSLLFNEPIVRESGMGAISYTIYDGNNLATVCQGNIEDKDLVASGNTLSVTLPDAVVFTGDIYAVTLSFAEGAVTDASGNKMAAVDGYIDAEGMPHGPWWIWESEGTNTGFLTEGVYTWSGNYNDGSTQSAFTSNTTFEYVGKTEFSGYDGDQWNVSGFMADVLNMNESKTFCGFAFDDGSAEAVAFLDSSLQNYATIGTVLLEDGSEGILYYLVYDGSEMYIPALRKMEDGSFVSYGNDVLLLQVDDQLYILAELSNLTISAAGEASVSNMAAMREQIKSFSPATAKKVKMSKEMRLIKR